MFRGGAGKRQGGEGGKGRGVEFALAQEHQQLRDKRVLPVKNKSGRVAHVNAGKCPVQHPLRPASQILTRDSFWGLRLWVQGRRTESQTQTLNPKPLTLNPKP